MVIQTDLIPNGFQFAYFFADKNSSWLDCENKFLSDFVDLYENFYYPWNYSYWSGKPITITLTITGFKNTYFNATIYIKECKPGNFKEVFDLVKGFHNNTSLGLQIITFSVISEHY